MREILFKAKRIDNGKWVEGYLFQIWERAYILWGTTNDVPNMIEVDANTICQYTGLTDKNGNKVWENDIVTVGVDRAIAMYSEKYSGYILQPIGDYYFDSPMLADNVDIIDNIIGNTFDNADLVKE